MGSMGVSIWPVHPSRICMDMPVRPWMFFFFFFFFFFQIQPYSVQHKTRIGPIWAEILVKKKLYNIRSKHTVLLADFKGKSLKSSQFSLDLSVSSLSLTQGSSSP